MSIPVSVHEPFIGDHKVPILDHRIDWVHSLLSDRSTVVNLGVSQSRKYYPKIGVPQGKV